MSKAAQPDGFALSWGVNGEDAPRLIIPLVRLEHAEPAAPAGESIMSWVALAARAADIVVVLDPTGRVLGVSRAAAELIGCSGPDLVVGRHLLEVLDLVDFNPTPGDASLYADRIAPLLAIASNALARGLLRLRTGGQTVTLDAIAAPIHEQSGRLAGAVAFLARLG